MSTEIGNNYLFLREDIHPPACSSLLPRDYRQELISWSRGLNPEQRALNVILKEQINGLLGVTSWQQIRSITEHPELRQIASKRVAEQLGLVYGIEDPGNVRQKFEDYGNDANSVIDYLQTYLSYPGCVTLQIVNEIRAFNDPTDLLLVSLDGRWTEKARFEAKRKLQLMGLSASIDRREREIGIGDQFDRFVTWMREQVWNPKSLFGASDGSFLISTHDPHAWTCTATQWLDEEEGSNLQLQSFQKKTHLPHRNFKTTEGNYVDVYVTIREKERKDKIIKMLRKRAEDPAIAVDDDTGLLVVVNHPRKFTSHLISRGYQSNYPTIIEDLSYTLDGGRYKGADGSSPNLRQMKFFIRLANEMRVECIIHTPETYAESLYRKGVSHDEYVANRLFDTGVPPLLFQKKHFPHFDMDKAREHKLRQIRGEIENT